MHLFRLLLVVCLILVAGDVFAASRCNVGAPFNPVTDPAWRAMFPLRVGGVSVIQGGNGLPDSPGGGTAMPMCACTTTTSTYWGLDTSYWEPGYLVEAVKDAFCMPALGTSLSTLDNGFYSGSASNDPAHPKRFIQAHWYIYPLIEIIGAFADMKCKTTGGVQLPGIPTELDPTYNNAILATMTDPTAVMFASPPFDWACAIPAAIAQVPGGTFVPGYNGTFWCWWDNIYPMTGDRFSPHEIESAATVASRQIYMKYKSTLLTDDTSNACAPVPGPVLPKKSDWRMQIVKPVRGSNAFVPGTSEFIMGVGKNPAFKDGNFLFLLFKKKRCCEKIKGS